MLGANILKSLVVVILALANRESNVYVFAYATERPGTLGKLINGWITFYCIPPTPFLLKSCTTCWIWVAFNCWSTLLFSDARRQGQCWSTVVQLLWKPPESIGCLTAVQKIEFMKGRWSTVDEKVILCSKINCWSSVDHLISSYQLINVLNSRAYIAQ